MAAAKGSFFLKVWIFIVVICFPISIPYYLSKGILKLFIKLASLFYLKEFFHKWFRILIEIIVFIAFVGFVGFCFIDLTFKTHLMNNTDYDIFYFIEKLKGISSGASSYISILWFILWLMLCAFFGWLLYFLLMIILATPYINGTKKKDKKISKAYLETGVTYTPPKRPFLNFLVNASLYNTRQKMLIHKKALKAKEDNTPSYDAGMIVNYEEYVMFKREFWKDNVLFLGSAKTGMTNTSLNWLICALNKNYPIIYFDADADQSSFHSLHKMSVALHKSMKVFCISEQHSLKYNPFYGKSSEELVDMFQYLLSGKGPFEEFKQEDVNKFCVTLVDLTEKEHLAVTFENLALITKSEHLPKIVKELKAKNKGDNFIAYLAERLEGTNPNLMKAAHFFFSDIAYANRHKNIVYHGGVTMKEMLKQRDPNTVVFLHFGRNVSETVNNSLMKLFAADISTCAPYNLRERVRGKNKTIVFASSNTNLFPSLKQAKDFVNSLNSNGFSIAKEIETMADLNGDAEQLDLLLDNFKTVFIHAIYDAAVAKKVGELIKRDSLVLVPPNYQYQQIKYNFFGQKAQDPNEVKAQVDAKKNALVSLIPNLKTGNVIYITEDTNDGNVRSIIYNKDIKLMKFESTLAKYLDLYGK